MSIDYSLIGARIQARRKQMHLTQEQWAEALSVSVGYISQVERGYSKANLEMLSKIAALLRCDLTEFLTGVSPGSKDFLNAELTAIVAELNDKQKKLLLEIAAVLKKQE